MKSKEKIKDDGDHYFTIIRIDNICDESVTFDLSLNIGGYSSYYRRANIVLKVDEDISIPTDCRWNTDSIQDSFITFK